MHIHMLVDAVVDPEPDQATKLIRNLKQARENAANGHDRELGNVAGHGSRDGTASESRQNSAGI